MLAHSMSWASCICMCACVHAKRWIRASVLQATLQRFTAAFDDTRAELQARAADTTSHLRAALAKKVDSEELVGLVQVCMHAVACCHAVLMSPMHDGAAATCSAVSSPVAAPHLQQAESPAVLS